MKKDTFVIYFLKHADSFDRVLMALGFIGAVGDGISMPVIMLMTSKLMNNLGNGDKLTFLHNMNKNAEILLFTSCGILLACFLEGYCWARTGERQARRLRMKYLKAILRQEVGYFDIRATNTTAQVITGVSGDSLVIQDTISEKVPNFLANMSMFVGGILFGFILQWRLALVAFPFILVLVAPGFMYGHVLIGLAKKNMEAYSKAGGIAEQAIASVKTVYSFVGEEKTVMEFSEALKETVKVGRKQGLAKGIVMGGSGLLFAVWAFIFWYGSRLVMYHGAKGGNVFAVGVLVGLSGQALGSGLSNLKSFSEASSAGERIAEVVERVPDIDSQDEKGEVLAQVLGEIEFKNVEFKYPSRPADVVLRNLTLKIPAGRTLALVGGSGSGKSTIISLLQRYYNANKGEIRIDGVEIDKLQLKWLRSQMGLVSQEPSLFSTSIKENIMFGKEGQVTMEEILEASENANAHNFISQLPQGYDTQVGEKGVHMSGGQKQRIAIARALIRKPRILLLDEATSALDSESERKVQEALDKAASCITTVMIAHRLSTIRNADIIAVIQCGEVVEIGSHDELCKNPTGIYNSLLKLQQVEVNTSDLEKEPTYHDFDANGDDDDSSFKHNSLTELIKNKKIAPNEDKQSKIPKIEIPPFLKLLLLNLPELKQALTGCLGAAITGGIQPLFGYCMGNMVYVFLLPNYSEVTKETKKYSLIFCGIAVVLVAVNIFQHSNFATMGEYLTKRIRENMLAKMLTFEVEWFEQEENSTGAVCSRLAKDANLVRSLIGDRISLLLQTLFLVIVSSTMGIIIAWRLAVVIIATQPIIIVCLYGRMVLLKKMSKNSIKSQEESSKLAAEVVANIRTVTSFSSQDRILSMFGRAQEVPRKGSNRQSLCAGVGLSICQAMISCNWALSFWYGGRLVYDGLIATKALLQTFLMLINTGKIIADVGCITTDLARGSDAVNSVFAVLNRHSKIHPDDPEGYQPLSIKGHVEFRDVHFVYPSRPNAVIFQSLSLVIDDGKSTALVGPSGSGKSTIIALIERFHDPVQGSVLIDGIDLKSYKLRSLRKHMAMVSQEPTLFSGTIRENIMYGSYEKADESEIISVAKAANAHHFITQLKDGYNTWCGEKGIQLSGGQKQRIAVARAILRNPSVLLLDEATSALDGPAERVVQDALERLMKGRTSVVVAHRLSTVQNCDQIVVMDKGAVVEKGTHTTLLEKGNPGAYFSLISLQQRID